MAEYVHPEVLVETDWLEANIEDPNIVVVEVDEDADAYNKGHIPNAIQINWETELHDHPRREFVPGEKLAELLGSKGLSLIHN
jgi:thiosulfate/3-mercaptopyruvate sulfurtransferase